VEAAVLPLTEMVLFEMRHFVNERGEALQELAKPAEKSFVKEGEILGSGTEESAG
jgi:hypothetical protein